MTKPREKTHEEVGLDGVKLIVGDKCLGMLEAVGEVFPEANTNGVPSTSMAALPQQGAAPLAPLTRLST